MMTLDEAIKHAEEVADTCEYEASKYDISDSYESYVACQEGECGEQHRQLAEWLKDYKRLKEQESILNEIRADIESAMKWGYATGDDQYAEGFEKSLEIIDKYKAQKEEQENEEN